MTVCVTTNTLDYRSIYPVLDPRRTAGPGPYMYAYGLAWDGVQINVARSPLLTSCQMRVNFVDSTNLSEDKEIQAWNLFNNDFVDRVGSAHLGLATTMPIRRTSTCGAGADTVVLCRYFAWPRGRTALYTFWPDDFWDFWGGCIVTFDWQTDTRGSGRWGNQTPQPTYPLVRKPDFTLMRDAAGTGFMVVFGGAGLAGRPL